MWCEGSLDNRTAGLTPLTSLSTYVSFFVTENSYECGCSHHDPISGKLISTPDYVINSYFSSLRRSDLSMYYEHCSMQNENNLKISNNCINYFTVLLYMFSVKYLNNIVYIGTNKVLPRFINSN